MIRVELTDDQAALVIRSLACMETVVRSKRPPNDYQRGMQSDRLEDIAVVWRVIAAARDTSCEQARG